MTHPLPLHRAHDYAALMDGWQRVANRARLHGVTLGSAGELPIVMFATAAAMRGEPAIYLSTGVHGDEPAPPWALLEWAVANVPLLREGAFILSPCLNPEGLIANTRMDGRGKDINRRFHLPRDPLIKAWRQFIKGLCTVVGICLHEDYDAQGCYLYELNPHRNGLGERLMTAVEEVLPRDPRRVIEGRSARNGIIRRKDLPSGVRGPEAIVLHELGCPITLTFETPSEFALDDRVQAQRRFIEASLEHFRPI